MDIGFDRFARLTETTERWKASSRKSGMLTATRYQTHAEQRWVTVRASTGTEVKILSQGTGGRVLKHF